MNTDNLALGAGSLPPVIAARQLHGGWPHLSTPERGWARRRHLPLLSALGLLALALPLGAASFSGNARVDISDPTNGLSWKTNINALMVQCWFKLSIPSGVAPSENMTILVNRSTSGDTSTPHAYNLWYDKNAGNIQFSTRGTNLWQAVLIPRPYLDRWYHVAVVRTGPSLTAYVDGLSVTNGTVGGNSSASGVSVGGWGNGKYLYGEVQEVAIRQLATTNIYGLMFVDQRDDPLGLVGYYKLSYSTNASDWYTNFAAAKPTGTERGTPYGPVLFEETDQKGEQSLFDSQVNGGKNAIVPLSGAFTWQHSALSRPVPGVPFDFRIGYSPNVSSSLGPGWTHSFNSKVVPLPGSDWQLCTWQGSVETWDGAGDQGPFTTRHLEYRGELVRTNNAEMEWTDPARITCRYFSQDDTNNLAKGQLAEIKDRNGNSMQLQWYKGLLFAYPTNIIDSAKGNYRLDYGPYGQQWLLTNVTYGDWQVRFAYTNNVIPSAPSQWFLASKSLLNTSGLYTNLNTTVRFGYNTNGFLERIIDALGNTNVLVRYDIYGRQVEIKNALGQSTRTEYGAPGLRQVRTTDAAGFQWIDTYDRKGRVIVRKNPVGLETRFTYDPRGNRTSTTDAAGNRTRFGYDDRGNLTAQTNALGEVSTSTYHPYFNEPLAQTDALGWTSHYDLDDVTGSVLRQWDALGTPATYTYTTNGLVATQTDANGNTTRFAYNTNGFRVAEINAAGFTNSYLVNDVGWTLAATNPLGEVTTYAYDLNSKVVRTADALGRVYTATYDANGNLLTRADAKGQVTQYTYDPLNRKIIEVDRAGGVTRYAYTVRGKQSAVTNALGFVTTFRYDAANGQINQTDALGNSVTTVFDDNGNVVASIDQLGQRWAKAYDCLNRVVAESDPNGNTAQTLYDAGGRVRETISPNGVHTVNSYDGRGRVTNRLDVVGSNWRYAYDGVGNITNLTDALGGHYVMAYDALNLRVLERNQDLKEWHYTYDRLGRLATQAEPNGTIRGLSYDAGGRLTLVSFPNTGRTNFFAYDANDNATNLLRSGSGPPTGSRLAYDSMDRIAQYTDAFNKTVGYAYDAAGRLTTLTYPDGKTLTQGYDPLNRLTNQVFQFGVMGGLAFNTSYAYDPAGRLVRRTYPNGIVQTNIFDNAGRLTGLSHSPPSPVPSAINVALAYAYDRNGNTVGRQEQGTFKWDLPALRDEMASYTNSGQLIQRAITITNVSQPRITYRYDASGNLTNAAAADGSQSWALTYDEDNRTTSICWKLGALCDKTVTNRYDAFGRRIARTVDGLETRYVLDLAGPMERVLCDVAPSGAIIAWYVHGLDLAYKVNYDGGLNCYHADAQANVIALSGGDGSTLVEYAYTPYGRSLGSTNYCELQPSLQDQPYLFVGAQGVTMEERGIPGLYFMRARYYSAEAGVFLSTDPVKNIGPTWLPIAYTYAGCNPLRFSDPKGELLNFVAAFFGAVVGGAIGAGAEVITEWAEHDFAFTGWDLNGKKIAAAAASGAITGFAGGLTMGASLPVTLSVNVAAGAAGQYVAGGIENKSNWTDPKAIAANLAEGAATGALAGGIGWRSGGKALYAPAKSFGVKATRMEEIEMELVGESWYKKLGAVLQGTAGPRNLSWGEKGFFSWGTVKEAVTTVAYQNASYWIGRAGEDWQRGRVREGFRDLYYSTGLGFIASWGEPGGTHIP